MSLYPNLMAELARRNLTKRDIAQALHKDGRTIRNRFNGSAPFTIPEAFAIRDAFFPGVSLDYLFQEWRRVKLKIEPGEIRTDGKEFVRAMFPDVAGAIFTQPR